MKKVERIGLIITVVWCLLISLLVSINWVQATKMQLNEWGDFLAGVTAPIAFLWLIVGYFLQRAELKQNTAALVEQREEMARQAEELAKHSEYLEATAKSARIRSTVALTNR